MRRDRRIVSPLRRAVERYLEDPLAEALLRGEIRAGDQVAVTVKTGTEELDFTTAKRPDPTPTASTEAS